MSVLRKKVLVTPLDWGLGHATRCVSIIHELLRQNCEVQIATSGSATTLLRGEFPELKIHELASYQITYSKILPFIVKMMIQVPRLLATIRNEHRQVEQIVSQEKIDIVISDNRYGCWSPSVKSILVIHQLTIISPVLSGVVNYFHTKAIKKFSRCWIPDDPGNESLSGLLSVNKKISAQHIGSLSRMRFQPKSEKLSAIAVISGPEPQRTMFEEIARRELLSIDGETMLVKGVPGDGNETTIGSLREVGFMSTSTLNDAILSAHIVVARSGYSTIMDLAALGKKAIFIPTPGQPEQEYLAEYLMGKKIAFSMKQNEFNLRTGLQEISRYSGFTRKQDSGKLASAIKELLE